MKNELKTMIADAERLLHTLEQVDAAMNRLKADAPRNTYTAPSAPASPRRAVFRAYPKNRKARMLKQGDVQEALRALGGERTTKDIVRALGFRVSPRTVHNVTCHMSLLRKAGKVERTDRAKWKLV